MLKDCKLPQFSVFRGVSHASEADIKKVVVWVFFVPHLGHSADWISLGLIL